MVDQRIIDYIKKEIAAGYKPEAIRIYLINYGYNPADVDAAMRAATAAAKPAAPAVPGKKIPIIPIAGGFLLLLLLWLLF